MFFHLYLILDVWSRKITGWEVHDRENGELAAQAIEKAVWAEGCMTRPLTLHADNGSPMKAATLRVTLERLGVTASFSRPRVSNDNPFSEAIFRTCKYVPSWPEKGFESLEAARAWVAGFVRWRNGEHRHSALRFVTPPTSAIASGTAPFSTSATRSIRPPVCEGFWRRRTESAARGFHHQPTPPRYAKPDTITQAYLRRICQPLPVPVCSRRVMLIERFRTKNICQDSVR